MHHVRQKGQSSKQKVHGIMRITDIAIRAKDQLAQNHDTKLWAKEL